MAQKKLFVMSPKKQAQLKKLSILLKAKIVDQNKDTNGWGGFDDDRVLRINDRGIFLVCTCGNCGDGLWTDVTSLLPKMPVKQAPR